MMEYWNIGSGFHRIEKYHDCTWLLRRISFLRWKLQVRRNQITTNLNPNSEVMRFWPLFHCSTIPAFHV